MNVNSELPAGVMIKWTLRPQDDTSMHTVPHSVVEVSIFDKRNNCKLDWREYAAIDHNHLRFVTRQYLEILKEDGVF